MERKGPIRFGYLLKRFIPYYKKYKWVMVLDLRLALTDDGIVEQGTHDELLNANSVYTGLYKLYT